MAHDQPMDACSVPGLTPLNTALTQLLNEVHPKDEVVSVQLENALGRVLAHPAVSTLNIPPGDNSAMDGYAFHVGDQPLPVGAQLMVVGKVFAGHPYAGVLKTGECVRIMTGGQLPQGANAVVMQEQATLSAEEAPSPSIHLQVEVSSGAHVRAMGEDIKSGQTVLHAGRRLRAADIGLLASLGIGEVQVTKSIRVAILSTGDELKRPGQSLAPGQFYESNRYVIAAGLKRMGVEVIDLGIVPDDLSALRDAFAKANEQADVVMTSGGVSVGEADYTKTVLEALGKIAFWKLAIKPGKPFAFGHLPNSYFIGLPGNPVSALVTFHQLAVPLLRKISGADAEPPCRLRAIAKTRIRKAPGRTDFQRGVYLVNETGQLEVTTTGAQGSGILSSMSAANCYIVIEQERGTVEAEESVWIEPFDEILK